MFECVNKQTDGRTDARTHGRQFDGYTISSPCETSAQVSYNITTITNDVHVCTTTA